MEEKKILKQFLAVVKVKIYKYPYSLQDLENIIDTFNDVNKGGMEVKLLAGRNEKNE